MLWKPHNPKMPTKAVLRQSERKIAMFVLCQSLLSLLIAKGLVPTTTATDYVNVERAKSIVNNPLFAIQLGNVSRRMMGVSGVVRTLRGIESGDVLRVLIVGEVVELQRFLKN